MVKDLQLVEFWNLKINCTVITYIQEFFFLKMSEETTQTPSFLKKNKAFENRDMTFYIE